MLNSNSTPAGILSLFLGEASDDNLFILFSYFISVSKPVVLFKEIDGKVIILYRFCFEITRKENDDFFLCTR